MTSHMKIDHKVLESLEMSLYNTLWIWLSAGEIYKGTFFVWSWMILLVEISIFSAVLYN